MTERERQEVSRRRFLETGGAFAGAAFGLAASGPLGQLPAAQEDEAAAPAPAENLGEIPTTTLGRTGETISVLGLGTALLGHQNNNRPEVAKLVSVFSEAIDRGVTYVDTARIYGRAEAALKTVLEKRRDKVFLATKAWAETYDEARTSFEESLRTLGVEHVDVLHLHSNGDKDTDTVLGDNGAWKYFQEAKQAGKARYLGITGHSRPARFVRMLETDTVDVMMVAMNFVDRFVYGFEEKVLPVARKHKTGVLAMKVFGGVVGGFGNYGKRQPHPSQLDAEHHLDSIRYAKTLEGVSAMVIGVHSAEQLRRNIKLVLEARPLAGEELDALLEKGKEIATGWSPRFGPVT